MIAFTTAHGQLSQLMVELTVAVWHMTMHKHWKCWMRVCVAAVNLALSTRVTTALLCSNNSTDVVEAK